MYTQMFRYMIVGWVHLLTNLDRRTHSRRSMLENYHDISSQGEI